MAMTPRMVGPVPGFELAGYGRSFLDAFSGRRRAILERLGLPYTPDCNDFCLWTAPGFLTAEHFYQYLRDTFDTLYVESATCPKMMSIGLHARMIGRPAAYPGSPASSRTRRPTRASGSPRASKSPATGLRRRGREGG